MFTNIFMNCHYYNISNCSNNILNYVIQSMISYYSIIIQNNKNNNDIIKS